MSSSHKNIVIVVHHYPPHITGVGFVAQSQATRLAAAGNDVTIISSKTSDKEISRMENGVKVVSIPAWNITERWSAPFPFFSPSLLVQLIKYIRHADVVHIHDAFYMSSFFGAMIAKIYKKPLALTQHVAMIAHPNSLIVAIQKIVYRTTGTLIFRWSDIIFTFNDRVEAFLIESGVPQGKIVHLPNGVDTDRFSPASPSEKIILKKQFGLDPNKKMILFVGRFVPKKGFDKVLAARSNDYEIVCAGGDAPKEKIDNVVFLGKMDQKALVDAYRAADIFLLPSESEGFPLSVQEAMACGIPVITTNDEGYARYHFDRSGVLLLDQRDETSIRNAINSIIGNQDVQKTMGDYSEQYAREHFSWRTIITTLNDTYERIIIKNA